MNRFLLVVLLLAASKCVVGQKVAKETTASKKAVISKYDSAISKATLSIAKGELEQARPYFNEALQLVPADPYAIKMINYLNENLELNRKKQLQDEEISRRTEIARLMKNASDAIIQKNYDSARVLYNRVIELKPDERLEEFANKKIAAINSVIGSPPTKMIVHTPKQEPIAKLNNDLLNPASAKNGKIADTLIPSTNKKQAVNQENHGKLLKDTATNARITTSARPMDQVSQNKSPVKSLKEQNEQLPKKPLLTNYDSVISKATLSIAKGQLEQARPYYNEALTLVPNDAYALKMINYLNENLEINRKKQLQDEEISRRTEIGSLMKNASNAIIQKNYDSARILYNRVIKLHPGEAVEDFANKKIATINAVIGLPLTKIVVTDTLKPETIAKENEKPLVLNPNKNDQKPESLPSTTNSNQAAMRVNYATVLKDTANKARRNTNLKSSEPIAGNKGVKQLLRDQKEPARKKTESGELTSEKINTKLPTRQFEIAGADKKIEKTKEKAISPSVNKIVKKGEPTLDEGSNKHEFRNADQLLDDAVKALSLKNYQGARALYEKVLISNSSGGKKDFAKMAIKAIDEQLKREQKK